MLFIMPILYLKSKLFTHHNTPYHIIIGNFPPFCCSSCGASLIWPNILLTAAHCFYDNMNNLIPPNFALIGGTIVPTVENPFMQTNAPEGFTFATYRIHPQYISTTTTVANDIALIVLNGQSKLPYANLTQTAPSPGTVLTSIGWGATETSKGSVQLMFANQLVATNPTMQCGNSVQPGSICMGEYAVPTGNGTKYQGTCRGDSGML